MKTYNYTINGKNKVKFISLRNLMILNERINSVQLDLVSEMSKGNVIHFDIGNDESLIIERFS